MDAKATAWRYLRAQREAVLWKVEGLPERDQRMPLTDSGTNLLGVVKHLAGVEAEYFGVCLGRPWPEPMAFWADDAEPNADPDNPFYGLTVCFTGSLPGMTRAAAAERIAAFGAQTVPHVTKFVDLLVVGGIEPRQLAPGAEKTGKLAKAERLRDSCHDITVIDAEEFHELLAVAEG